MRLDSKSLAFRLFIPNLVIIAIITIALLLMVKIIADHVQEDYHKFIVSAASKELSKLLASAASDLTSAKLLDNPVVVEAKQLTVQEAIKLSLGQSGYHGVITGPGGELLLSTLSKDQTAVIIERQKEGYFLINNTIGKYYCHAQRFPLWGWTVITVDIETKFPLGRKEVAMLVPMMGLAILLMAGALFWMLWRNIQRPVNAMVSSVAKGQDVSPAGITEFDAIGSAINDTMGSLKQHALALEGELAERKRAEDQLHSKDMYLRLILESAAEGIYGMDLNGTCTFVNPSCLKMLGYENESDLLGKIIHDMIHHTYPDGSRYPNESCNAYRAFRENRAVHVRGEVFWRADGVSFPVEYRSVPIFERGHMVGAVVSFVDFSEQRRLETQLIHAQKMEAVGHLAGGIAHDFNNILTAILGYGEMLQEEILHDDPKRLHLEQMILAAQRAAELTTGLLAFSRKQVIRPRPVDLNAIVADMDKLLVRVIGEDVRMHLKLHANPLVVMVDKGQIGQVLMNLVTNARDAMPDGGMLSIETGDFLVDDDTLLVHNFEKSGHYAYISVSDTGQGMDEGTRSRIFEPFYTTKEMGRGTGLGLAIVYGIVKQHAGYINVYSEPSRGSTFRIYLPLIAQNLNGQEQKPETPPQGKGETVLVVEDDTAVRDMLKAVLGNNGYRVIDAPNGPAGIETFKENSDSIALVLMDVVMPALNGKQTLEAIQGINPEVKAIFMSGYTDDIIHREGIFEEGMNFIEKPIVTAKLLRLMRDVIEG